MNRLKYHYAVAEFDCVESASRVYSECDGREYELSATRFDLRFVPDDTDFDGDARSECTRMPDASRYKPKQFTTSALQMGKVELTWDETDPERAEAMRRMFEAASDDDAEDGDDDEDVRRLIGSGDDDEDGVSDGDAEADLESDDDGGEANAIEKYKKLLGDLKEQDKKKKSKWAEMEGDDNDDGDEGGNMEMVFEDDTKSEQATKEELDSMTPWEKYLHKKREKKKAKKLSKSAEAGFDDPFFAEAEQSKTQQKKQKKEKKLKKKLDEENAEKGDLSLFTMDSDDEKEHFDFKEIVKKQSKKGKKKQKQLKAEEEESFSVDLEDGRFAAVFENPEYNVDPSHPSFKKTRAMQDIIAEKQRRIVEGSSSKKRKRPVEEKVSKVARKSDDVDLDKLVTSVKTKAKKKRKQQR